MEERLGSEGGDAGRLGAAERRRAEAVERAKAAFRGPGAGAAEREPRSGAGTSGWRWRWRPAEAMSGWRSWRGCGCWAARAASGDAADAEPARVSASDGERRTWFSGWGRRGPARPIWRWRWACRCSSGGMISRVVLTRPAVEAGEALGFCPATCGTRSRPYLRPLYDALHDMLDPEEGQRYLEDGTIEIAPLAFMRGRTLAHSFVILDEAQNTTREQMFMALTRLGEESRGVVTGDLTQVDLRPGVPSRAGGGGGCAGGGEGDRFQSNSGRGMWSGIRVVGRIIACLREASGLGMLGRHACRVRTK